jgi:hypothetical protein
MSCALPPLQAAQAAALFHGPWNTPATDCKNILRCIKEACAATFNILVMTTGNFTKEI